MSGKTRRYYASLGRGELLWCDEFGNLLCADAANKRGYAVTHYIDITEGKETLYTYNGSGNHGGPIGKSEKTGESDVKP